jgi:hypothetical protein
MIGIGLAICLPCRFPGMIKSNSYYYHLVVADYRNCPCHLFTMQVSRHDQVHILVSLTGGCKVSELVMPFVYHAGFH